MGMKYLFYILLSFFLLDVEHGWAMLEAHYGLRKHYQTIHKSPQNKNSQTSECSICSEPLSDKKTIILHQNELKKSQESSSQKVSLLERVPHEFHRACLRTWAQKNPDNITCPFDRKPLTTQEYNQIIPWYYCFTCCW
jgi:hypothetical protein